MGQVLTEDNGKIFGEKGYRRASRKRCNVH